MMDRLAALADILPPPHPAPLPSTPWWQQPGLAWALAAALLLTAWAVVGWRRRRVWTQLRRHARRVRSGSAPAAPAATQLAAALRQRWPETAWPSALRNGLDDLRFAPRPDAARLRQLALAVEAACARAARAAWWSHARAQRCFEQTLHAALQEAA